MVLLFALILLFSQPTACTGGISEQVMQFFSALFNHDTNTTEFTETQESSTYIPVIMTHRLQSTRGIDGRDDHFRSYITYISQPGGTWSQIINPDGTPHITRVHEPPLIQSHHQLTQNSFEDPHAPPKEICELAER